MSAVNRVVGDLRDKRVIVLAAGVLVAAMIAVPVLLSKSASSPVVAQLPATSQGAQVAGVPVVNTGASPSAGKLNGHSRDPFTQEAQKATKGLASAVGTTGTPPTKVTSTTSSSGSSTTASSTSGASTTAPTATIPTGTPTPAPPGLKSTQSYEVKLAITNSSGGVDTTDSLERLSVLPSKKQPLLVELGVLKGGNRVLFAVQPGAVVSGAGTCVPGPIDCEILSLPQDQTVTLGKLSSNGIQTVALFAVTGIRAADHGSASAAKAARQQSSADGRALLDASSSAALSLFEYDPSIGAVLDLRNLTVGG